MEDKEKSENNTGVYFQIFLPYYAKFMFLNLIGSFPIGLNKGLQKQSLVSYKIPNFSLQFKILITLSFMRSSEIFPLLTAVKSAS